ncbi:MAG: hypothetical protein JXA77_03825 [Bacteroidales bacterium]|nr:hypothetical protein [Bacteroidales bacterium]MBN2820320.1 hypothetical protein [Bacteroidales bacterium]
MRVTTILSIGIILFSQNLAAQKYHKAVVTDINYLLRLGEGTNQETFPMYFQHQEFINDIQSDIARYSKNRFGVDTVIFDNPGKINYLENFTAPKLKVKEAAKSGEKGTIYISVETILQLSIMTNTGVTYSFMTRVKAYNHKGRSVYKFKNKIPFTPMIEEDIVGAVEMSEQDFYVFYFDGLLNAFEGKIKREEKRYNLKPPTEHYSEFLSNAEKFYLVPNYRSYLYGRSMDDLKEVVTFKDKFFDGLDNEFDLGNIFEGNKVRYSYRLTNTLKNEDYIIKIKSSESTLFNFLSISSGVQIAIQNDKKEDVGEFQYSYNELEGTFKEKKYKIIWIPEFYCAEVTTDDGLKILINELGDRKVLFIHNSLSEEQLEDIFNLAFIYDFAAQAQAEAEAKASNDAAD